MSRKMIAVIVSAMMLMAQTPAKRWYATGLMGAKYVYVWKACSSWSTPQYWIPVGRIYQVDPVNMPGGQRFQNDGWLEDLTRVWAVRVIGAPITQSFYIKESCIVGAEYR